MIRALLLFVLIAAIALVVVFIADLPGTVTIGLQNREIRLGIPVAATIVIFLSFLTLVQSLSFWLGNTTAISQLALSALLTFSLYPGSLFEGAAKFILLTIIPASLIGSLPAEFVKSFSWGTLLQLLASAVLLMLFSIWVFYRGLKRYESGSVMQAEI